MSTAPLIDSIHFKNYRNFIDFEMKDLSHVNLIVGDSNVGKTGLLEGLVTLWGSDEQFDNLPNTFRMSIAQNVNAKENYWQWFFPEKNIKANLALSFQVKATVTECFFRFYPSEVARMHPRIMPGALDTNYQSGINKIIILPVGMGDYYQQIDQFNELSQKNNGKEKLIASLQIIEPRLKGLEYLKLPSSNEAMIYADIGLAYKIPTTQFGHGFTRSMEMLTQLILSDAQIMIADEIENGIHYSSLESVWKAIISYAMDNDIQIFATTHSRECISAAHQAMLEQDNYSLNVIRLQNENDQVVAINNSQEDIEAALSMGMPLR